MCKHFGKSSLKRLTAAPRYAWHNPGSSGTSTERIESQMNRTKEAGGFQASLGRGVKRSRYQSRESRSTS